MEIKIIKDSITKTEVEKMAKVQFGDIVKVVVDVKQEIIGIGGEFHADVELLLTEKEGSSREHTWGINLRPQEAGAIAIEFDSLINIKPALGNRSRNVESPEIRKNIEEIVRKLISE